MGRCLSFVRLSVGTGSYGVGLGDFSRGQDGGCGGQGPVGWGGVAAGAVRGNWSVGYYPAEQLPPNKKRGIIRQKLLATVVYNGICKSTFYMHTM